MQKRKYNILFGFLILCLLFHLAFKPFNWIKDLDLSGYFTEPEFIGLTAENYFSSQFQDTTEKSLNFNFGLFPGFTRIHHQIEYSFFNRMHVKDVHSGKKGYLFRYCDICMSDRDFGPDYIESFLNKYKVFQDSLKAAGKNIVWVIAPDKNFTFSEYLPEEKHVEQIYPFYWTLRKGFIEKGINFIDFNELAFREKNKFQFEVFNKGGVHWTNAYANRCFDSICSYLSQNTDIKIKNTITLKKINRPWSYDIDMEIAGNLLLPLKQDNFYSSEIESESNAHNKKLLLIGDSFTHAWVWKKVYSSCFHPESEFWYYNRDLNTLENKYIGPVSRKDTRKNISKFDTFIIVFTALNAEQLTYGFIEDVYQ
ncbi:MAG: hypothetical protein IPP64_05410 [Bacteroidetes bacterium]|nr:hypothetical protein [Bacteroidota bacterium]